MRKDDVDAGVTGKCTCDIADGLQELSDVELGVTGRGKEGCIRTEIGGNVVENFCDGEEGGKRRSRYGDRRG
jgi:hypothetical protein